MEQRLKYYNASICHCLWQTSFQSVRQSIIESSVYARLWANWAHDLASYAGVWQ